MIDAITTLETWGLTGPGPAVAGICAGIIVLALSLSHRDDGPDMADDHPTPQEAEGN